METIEDIRKECKLVVRALVNSGNEVCNSFNAKPNMTYFCDTCGYSQYIHLAKRINELNK